MLRKPLIFRFAHSPRHSDALIDRCNEQGEDYAGNDGIPPRFTLMTAEAYKRTPSPSRNPRLGDAETFDIETSMTDGYDQNRVVLSITDPTQTTITLAIAREILTYALNTRRSNIALGYFHRHHDEDSVFTINSYS